MNQGSGSSAFGAPGIEPRWTSSAKEGLGTAYNTSCHLWFTLSHGIVNEIYYPHVDQPNTRDFQFLVSDGSTFCHEEKRDLLHEIHYVEKDCLFYRLINSDKRGRYRLIKDVITDPHRSVLLVRTRLEVMEEALRGRLKVFALLAPHINRYGAGNSGWCDEIGGNRLLHASRGAVHLVLGCGSGFKRRSVGFVGASDGWQDLMAHRDMTWQFCSAENGNIALTGEIDFRDGEDFTVAIALGRSLQSAAVKLMQSLAEPFEAHQDGFVRQWQRTVVKEDFDFKEDTSDGGHLYRLSRCILLAHEDKTFEGALVASMSIPWGETKNDNDLGGYHLVWTRDLVHSATALLASGQVGTPTRALIWLAAIQRQDGLFPQNSWIDGNAYWCGLQLDEIAAPILLAWYLKRSGAEFHLFDPCVMIFRAASYLILQGPVTAQERWEENSGFSPSTLATVIASLVCGSIFAEECGENSAAALMLDEADWMADHVEEWTVTTCGKLVPERPCHYIRINPTDQREPDPHADPDTALLDVKNGGGTRPARNVVGGDFLQLVRLGIRAADDPIVRDSIDVIDRVLKRDLPQGPCWRRYNHDGYGQKADGEAFDGTGIGRSWPLLTGERGHYALAAGEDPMPYLAAMEGFANQGGMLSEQLWDDDDLPGCSMRRGLPTGAAMPLCWAHSEYISLARSRHDGICFDRVEPAFLRYVAKPVRSRYEIWTFRHPIRRMPRRKILRIVLGAQADIIWTIDGWQQVQTQASSFSAALRLWFAELPTDSLAEGDNAEFTFFWKDTQRWEGRNFAVAVDEGRLRLRH